MTELKKCGKCGELKPYSEFHNSKYHEDGKKPYCKQCWSRYYGRNAQESREYVNKNQEVQMVAVAKQRAKKQGVYFDLKPSDVSIPDACPILGIPLQRGRRTKSDNSPTLDRIDPSKGYIRGNVWVISAKAKNLKLTRTIIDLILEVDALVTQSL